MLNLKPYFPNGRRPRILCLGAHSDDIEIGCGGTILRLVPEYAPCEVRWVVFSAGPERRAEAAASADRFLRGAGVNTVEILDFRVSYFPQGWSALKDVFERIKLNVQPDVIFTHYRQDLHQDHRTIAELTWNTFRDHLILEYEVLKYDGDLGSPNLFVELDAETCRKKIGIITECFRSQATKDWFTADAFAGLMRIRGVEARASQRFAEGFYCRKAVL